MHVTTLRSNLSRICSVLLGAWTIALLCGMASPLRGQEALILLSREGETYRKAADAARVRLEQGGLRVTTEVVDQAGSETNVSAVIALGTEAGVWAKAHAATDSTVVACLVANLEAAGLTQGRVVHAVETDISAADQLTLIRGVLPQAKKIGVPVNPGSARGKALLEDLRTAAGTDWSIIESPVKATEAFSDAIDALLRQGVDLIWMMPDSNLYSQATIQSLLQTTLRAKVPVYGFSVPLVKAGALIGAGIDPIAHARQAADLALEAGSSTQASRRSVRGRYESAINLAVARQLGIMVSPAAASQATHVFSGE